MPEGCLGGLRGAMNLLVVLTMVDAFIGGSRMLSTQCILARRDLGSSQPVGPVRVQQVKKETILS